MNFPRNPHIGEGVMADMREKEVRYLGDVQRLVLNTGDTLVLTVDAPMSNETAHRIRKALEEKFPGHTVLVLDQCMKIGVLGSAA